MARKKNENKMRRKGRAQALYISYYGGLQVFNKKHTSSFPLFLLIYMLPKRYKRKYLGWLQGETRKLHKIFENKNLTESVHKYLEITQEGFAYHEKFRMVCEIPS